VKEQALKGLIIESLTNQGFQIKGNRVLPPSNLDKEAIRKLHAQAVTHQIESAEPALAKRESKLLSHVANGSEVAPEYISPRLVEVQPETENALLFRYATLHWSIPISTGYGRRLRFLVIDDQNNKLIGVIGLGDPVFNLGARDGWIGWDKQARRENLNHVMDAFVLGAIPPYSKLLCGKLVAMLATSNEVRLAFKKKYSGQQSLIRQKKLDARLALIATSSAFGRSSIYNRLKYRDRLLFHSVGYTRGFGEFHFSNGVYQAIAEYAVSHAEPTAKNELWGKGFRNKREVVRKSLISLGIQSDWTYHGVRREVFVAPLAKNAQEFLRGEHCKMLWLDQPVEDLAFFFKERWLFPRIRNDQAYKSWDREMWRLWPEKR